jgi:hypothetical protein
MPAHPDDKRLALAPALLRLMGRETANIHARELQPSGSGETVERAASRRALVRCGD